MLSLKDHEFLKLVEYIKSRYGINLQSKRHLIEGRLCNMITEKGFSSFDAYFNQVFSSDSKEDIMLLLNKLTTNHTFFMREEEHFNYLEKTVLPYLHDTVRDRDLRIWSAGCSSGEESYTLAMILQEYFARETHLWDKKILATDISTDVLQKAIRGIYASEQVEPLDNKWRHKYFQKYGAGSYQVTEALRKEVIFRIFNLMEDFPFRKKFHVIFCRNVMIYFDQPTKDKIIQKFYDITEPGGYLFIGLSESIRREATNYEYIMPSVYRKG